jgi:non-ribosomal peptide synthetase component F
MTAVQAAARHPLGAFAERVASDPAAPALAWAEGAISYGELYALTCDAAAQLEYRGVSGRVAVLGPKSPESIALVLACLLSGRPALLPAAEVPRATVGTLIERAGVEHVLNAGVVVPSPFASVEPAGAVAPGDVALMLATSGSTGLPKVVPITFGAIARFAAWAAPWFGIEPGTTVLSYCGLNFDLSILARSPPPRPGRPSSTSSPGRSPAPRRGRDCAPAGRPRRRPAPRTRRPAAACA